MIFGILPELVSDHHVDGFDFLAMILAMVLEAGIELGDR